MLISDEYVEIYRVINRYQDISRIFEFEGSYSL